jgi:hypothetical protein
MLCDKLTPEQKKVDPNNREELETRRVGYQVAANLWGINNDGHWARFNAMLIANSLIISLMGLIITNKQSQKVTYELLIFASVIGLAFTVLWYLLMRKDFHDIRQYIYWTRCLEECCGSECVQTVRDHKTKSPRDEILINLTIFIFGVIFGLALIFGSIGAFSMTDPLQIGNVSKCIALSSWFLAI